MDPNNSISYEHKEAKDLEENKRDEEGEDGEKLHAPDSETDPTDSCNAPQGTNELDKTRVDVKIFSVQPLTSDQKSETGAENTDIVATATSKGSQHTLESQTQKCPKEEQDPNIQTKDICCTEDKMSPAVSEAEEDLLETTQNYRGEDGEELHAPDSETESTDSCNTSQGTNELDTNQEQKIHHRSIKRPAEQEPGPKGQTENASSVQDVSASSPITETKGKVIKETVFKNSFLVIAIFVALVAIWKYRSGSPPPQLSEQRSVDIFHKEIEKVKLNFPSQRAELWKRSKIHLTKHLQADQPKEPASMILTAGHRAEKTLRCLAIHIADALSTALNTTVLQIDGAGKASLDSDIVKLDIDEKLRMAFEGNKGTAVIHRFEDLPPGSTLIFYRYCDHENAAFKEASLIFTVLLTEKDEVQNDASLSDVEEMVQEHIQDRFLSSVQPETFDKMDIDKLAGLWSRISHLILPVAAEEHIELQGCEM
ncbi:torsin-1A-interacting protein 2-like isoform X1 [Arapaima gigas]